MQEYINFFIAHWALSLIFIAAFIWVIIVEAKSRGNKAMEVTPAKAIELINREKAKIFDIRPAEKFAQGHIAGAKNTSAEQFHPDKIKALKLKPQQVLIIVCMRGISAKTVAKTLRQQGFTQTYVLAGGMQGWQQADMPIIKG